MAELGARVTHLGKAGKASHLAAALTAAIGSLQGRHASPRGLIAPAHAPGRAAHLLAVLTVNLARVELAPLAMASAAASDVLMPLLAAQQVSSGMATASQGTSVVFLVSACAAAAVMPTLIACHQALDPCICL